MGGAELFENQLPSGISVTYFEGSRPNVMTPLLPRHHEPFQDVQDATARELRVVGHGASRVYLAFISSSLSLFE